jgi:Uncharacterized protein conserved in bacteria
MSLFRGRDDVYARKWQNKEGKFGYSPVCLNEWAKEVCNKPKTKCSGCMNKDYAIFDLAAIDKQLNHMLNILSSGINNGAKITIVTRPETDYKEKDKSAFLDMLNSIRLAGANLIFKPNIHG